MTIMPTSAAFEPSTAPCEEAFTNPDGQKIVFRSWRPATAPRALLVICHGVNSHGGQYGWAAEQFAARGFVVYAIDLRGRGLSDGERFYVERVEDYVSDLAQLIALAKTREPGLPAYLLGHSAGGVVSATFALEHGPEIDGLICESFAFQVPAPDLALAVIKVVSRLLPYAPVLKLKIEDFTRDPAALARLNADLLIADEAQPAATVAALVRADERLKRHFPQITVPVFILHGTADKATRPQGSQMFFDRAGSADKTLKLYEGHVHDLLADLGKETVLQDMLVWMESRLPA